LNAEQTRIPNHEDGLEQTPLHWACQTEDGLDAANASVELLQFGATTVKKADCHNRTPVELAMGCGFSEAVKILEPLVHDPDLKLKITTWWKEREETDPA
jgi:ankyrin repeat protein